MADVDYICHQVNCQGVMNTGIAKSIREKWPLVYENYMIKYNDVNENCPSVISPSFFMLGTIQIVPIELDFSVHYHKDVINLFAQDQYGDDNKCYTSYDAFWSCINQLKCLRKGSSIGFPGHIGCCRGGANWNVIRTMIEEVLGKDYEIYIYRLEK